MRVISGKARRTILVTPEGLGTRPTTDRIKETLFNIISNEIYDVRFLDLFSGSGGIGIEAASRGASYCAFVEHNPEACRCIKENIKHTHLEDVCELYESDIFQAIENMCNKKEKVFDIIFIDPPYKEGLEVEVLKSLKKANLINLNTKIIIEAAIKTEFNGIDKIGFEIVRVKEYKTNKHVFIEASN